MLLNHVGFLIFTVFLLILSPAVMVQAQVGHRYPSEKTIVHDAITGVPMTVLTNGQQSDAKIYQTHPQWTSDGKWIIFHSSGRAPGSQGYAVNESTGDIIQLTQGAGLESGSFNIAQKSMKLYFVRNASAALRGIPQPATHPTTLPSTQPAFPNDRIQMIELDLNQLFTDSYANTIKPANEYERIVVTFPDGMHYANGIALDSNEKTVYVSLTGGDVGKHLPPGVEVMPTPSGARMGAGPAGLRLVDIATGEMKHIIDTPFKIGHVQSNPFVTGEIVYCYETGGDASQRMWTVHADGTGNRPLFVEGPDDWVTHETVVTKDEVMFNLIGHLPRLRKRPTGIAVINLRTDAVQLLGQVEERGADKNDLPTQNAPAGESYGGFWHCNGSSDGKWAVGDTFGGNVWLINRKNGQMTLLSTDHKMKPDHCHPTFDPSGKKILIQSGHFTEGKRLSLIVLPVPE